MTNVKYTLKIWLTGLLMPPLLIAAAFAFEDLSTFGFSNIIGSCIGIMILFTFIGCLFSLPSLLLLGLAVSRIGKYASMTNIKAKIACSVIGAVLTVGPFMLLMRGVGFDALRYFMLTYVAVIIASVWFYRYEPHALAGDPALDEVAPIA